MFLAAAASRGLGARRLSLGPDASQTGPSIGQAGAAPPEAGPGACHPGECKQPREDPLSFPRCQRGASQTSPCRAGRLPHHGQEEGWGPPGMRKKTLGAQLSFLSRGPYPVLDTPTVYESVLSHTSELQPRDCPSNWMPPKTPNFLKSSACSPPLLPPPQTSGSPSTKAAPAHLLLKPEAWEPSWMHPPLHLAPSAQPRAWECRLPNRSEAHCAAACWTLVPQPAGLHSSPPRPPVACPSARTHPRSPLQPSEPPARYRDHCLQEAGTAAPPRPAPTTSLPDGLVPSSSVG